MSAPEFEIIASGQEGYGWSIRRGTLTEGLSAGVEVVEVAHGDFSFRVLTTRGMGIWDAHVGDLRVGWNSPVKQPVHPAFVNVKSRNGLGWLDGFNELLCRCGLSFNGPPGTDEGMSSPVESDVTLHGRVANLPAHSVEAITEGDGRFGVKGIVDEATLFGPQLRLETSITTEIGQNAIRIQDQITNLGSAATELSLLYHTNIGPQILGEGSRLSVPATKVLPNNARSAEDAQTWQTYLPPTPGYAEQVYFFETLADENGETLALLESPDGNIGFAVEFKKSQLPCFTQWKATQALQEGYVTGLEPSTNLPNFKTFEREQGRIISLAAGETYETELTLRVLTSATEVDQARQRISEIQGEYPQAVSDVPEAPYCVTE